VVVEELERLDAAGDHLRKMSRDFQ
jgi:hypothetical protein